MPHASCVKSLVLFAAILTACSWPAMAEDVCLARKLPVYFRDAQNLLIQNIPLTDLQAKVHGQPAKIVSLTLDTRARRIVLFLDVSSSMCARGSPEPPLWPLEMIFALHFFDLNQRRAQLAFITFNGKVNQIASSSDGISRSRVRSSASRMTRNTQRHKLRAIPYCLTPFFKASSSWTIRRLQTLFSFSLTASTAPANTSLRTCAITSRVSSKFGG